MGCGSWSNGRGLWSDGPMVVGGGDDSPMVDDCGSMGMGRGYDGLMVMALVLMGCGSRCSVFNGSWVQRSNGCGFGWWQ